MLSNPTKDPAILHALHASRVSRGLRLEGVGLVAWYTSQKVHRVEDIVAAVSGHSFNPDYLYAFTVDNSTHTAGDELLDVLPALITFQLRRKWVWVRRHDLYRVA